MADLRAQYQGLKSEIDRAVLEVLGSAQFILGDQVSGLEQRIAAYCGAAHGIGVASGTDALLLPLAAMGIGPGDEVITSAFTFVATAEVVCLLGATPVFADIDPVTFTLDPAAVAEKITPRTRAIMPVHLYGQLADMTALSELARRHNLRIVEDAAQAIGAAHRGRRAGAWGDAAGLSFFPTKNLGAAGDGGMVLTNDAALDEKVRRLRFHGSGGSYFYSAVGYNSRLDSIQAAILNAKMDALDAWNEARRANAAYYLEALADTPLLLPREVEGNRHIYHQFTTRVPAEVDREALRTYLQERGVASAIYYPLSIHLQEAYERFGGGPGSLPETERAQREVLSLPVFPEMTAAQREHVTTCVRSFFGC